MVELDQVLLDLLKPLVVDKENLSVTVEEGKTESDVILHVHANSEDIARMIGKKGTIATSVRQVLSIATTALNKHFSIYFEQN